MLDFSFNRLDEMNVEASLPAVAGRLKPRGRYTLAASGLRPARLHPQPPTAQHTAGHYEPLGCGEAARPDAARGRDVSAPLDNREVRSRLRPALDEVEYFARLHLRQYRRASVSDVSRSGRCSSAPLDLRVGGGLPADRPRPNPLCDRTGRPRATRSRCRRPNCSSWLSPTSSSPHATPASNRCSADPSRDITFVPTPREPSRPALGFLADDRPERATGNLYDLLTADAVPPTCRTLRSCRARPNPHPARRHSTPRTNRTFGPIRSSWIACDPHDPRSGSCGARNSSIRCAASTSSIHRISPR